MIIVLEGADGVGKTMYAQALVDRAKKDGFKTVIHHASQPTTDDLAQEYLDALADYRPHPGTRELVVHDRLHLGELVYGPLYRGKSLLSEEDVQRIEARLVALGAVRVLLDEDFAVVEKRLALRGEDFLRAEHVVQVLERYRHLGRQYGWHRTRATSKAGLDSVYGLARLREQRVVREAAGR